jgi:hypothetical protein
MTLVERRMGVENGPWRREVGPFAGCGATFTFAKWL